MRIRLMSHWEAAVGELCRARDLRSWLEDDSGKLWVLPVAKKEPQSVLLLFSYLFF